MHGQLNSGSAPQRMPIFTPPVYVSGTNKSPMNRAQNVDMQPNVATHSSGQSMSAQMPVQGILHVCMHTCMYIGMCVLS